MTETEPKKVSHKGKSPKKPPAEGSRKSSRETKPVDAYKPAAEAPKSPQKAKPEGKGVKLRNIPEAFAVLNKFKGDDAFLELFHGFLFKGKGKATTRKKDVLDFAGFNFDSADERAKKAEKLTGWKKADLSVLLEAFGLSKTFAGAEEKEAKVKEVLASLEKPAAKGTKAPAKRKSTGAAANGETKPAKKAKKGGKEAAEGEAEPMEEDAVEGPANKKKKAEPKKAAPKKGAKGKAAAKGKGGEAAEAKAEDAVDKGEAADAPADEGDKEAGDAPPAGHKEDLEEAVGETEAEKPPAEAPVEGSGETKAEEAPKEVVAETPQDAPAA